MKSIGWITLIVFPFLHLYSADSTIVSFSLGNEYVFTGSLLVIPTGQPTYISASFAETVTSDTVILGHKYFVLETQNSRWAPMYSGDTGHISYWRADSNCIYAYSLVRSREDTIVNFSDSVGTVYASGNQITSKGSFSLFRTQHSSVSTFLGRFAPFFFLADYPIYGLYEGEMVLTSARINNTAYGDTILLSVSSRSNYDFHLPDYFLYQNYPNPFNPTTEIEYYVPTKTYVTVKVYDVSGKAVADLVDGIMESGMHKVEFNATALTSGVYFCCLKCGPAVLAKKLILLK